MYFSRAGWLLVSQLWRAVYGLVRNPVALRIYAVGLFGLLLLALVPGIDPVAVSVRSQLARIPSAQRALALDPSGSEPQTTAQSLFTYLARRVDYQAFQPYVTVDLSSLAKNIDAEEKEYRGPPSLRSAIFPQLNQVTYQVIRLTFIVDNTLTAGNSSEPVSISDFQRLTRFSAAGGLTNSQSTVALDGQSIVFHRNEGDLTFSLQALLTALAQDQTTDQTITNVGWNTLRVANPTGKKILQLTELDLEKREGNCSATRVNGFLLEK